MVLLFLCLQFFHGPGPKSWSNHCFIVYKSGGLPAPKVDKTIVPLFIGKNLDSPSPKIRGTPIVYCLSFQWKESQTLDNQSLKLKQQ
nr:MAG: hypothetical protein [Bacteriophage sp.]